MLLVLFVHQGEIGLVHALYFKSRTWTVAIRLVGYVAQGIVLKRCLVAFDLVHVWMVSMRARDLVFGWSVLRVLQILRRQVLIKIWENSFFISPNLRQVLVFEDSVRVVELWPSRLLWRTDGLEPVLDFRYVPWYIVIWRGFVNIWISFTWHHSPLGMLGFLWYFLSLRCCHR